MSCTNEELYSQITAEGKILCKRRDTFDLTVEITNKDDNSAYDMTVFTELILQVKKDPRETSTVLSASLGSGLTVSNTNRVQIQWTDSQMDIPFSTYQWDMQGKKADGTVITVAQGSFEVTSDISNVLV